MISLKQMWRVTLLFSTASLILGFTIGYVTGHTHQSVVTCHWQVPLKANYQACSDGTVKEVK